jgi:hypothetical protein
MLLLFSIVIFSVLKVFCRLTSVITGFELNPGRIFCYPCLNYIEAFLKGMHFSAGEVV